MIDPDRFNLANPRRVGNTAFAVIDAIQQRPAEEQVLGMATAFMALCQLHKQHPGNVFQTVQNILNASGKRPEVRALESYLKEELPV